MCTFWALCSHVCEPNLSWKVVENEFCVSWKTLEFGLCKSWKVLENSILLSVRTLYKAAHVASVKQWSVLSEQFKHMPLYLEWAPVDVFKLPAAEPVNTEQSPSKNDDKVCGLPTC